LVAAAGNEGTSTPDYPAAYHEVISVGAIDSSGNVPGWSNRNPELVAPGVDILSTYIGGSYATLSGTSMATPHVAGTVALIQASRLANNLPLLPPGNETDMDSTTVRGILHLTAISLGSNGDLYGYGCVNASAAVLMAING
jgi:subtilisin